MSTTNQYDELNEDWSNTIVQTTQVVNKKTNNNRPKVQFRVKV